MSEARPEDASDDELAVCGLAGSQAALAELYRRYRPRVFAFLLRMTGDRDLADEVFAATFATFFEHLPRYRPCGRLAAYLLRIARSRLADEQKARGRFATPLPTGMADDTPADTVAPDEAAASAELAERAHRALAELPEHLREVVVLRLYEGLDYAAVAEVVGAGEATVRSRMRYALQALRRSVQPIPDA